jgi:DNA topoisomerase-1
MRTDSVNLSGQAIAAASDYIKRLYGTEYSTVRKFKTKSAGAQEAHEAIRPTDITRESVGGSDYDQKLYDLIRRRTLASQMSPAKLENTTIKISFGDKAVEFTAKGSVIVFDGFLRVYGGGKQDDILPTLALADTLALASAEARQTFNRPPARYTEGTLVKKLEELGIGRPSTYAPTISTVQKRGYVLKEDRNGVERSYQELTLRLGVIKAEIKKQIT